MWRLLGPFKTLFGVVAILLLPVFFLKVQRQVPTLSDAVYGTFLDLSATLQESVLWVFSGVSDFLEKRSIEAESREEIFELRTQKSKIRSLEILLTESEQENSRLKALLHFSRSLDNPRALGALVIGQVGAPLMRVIQIDQGSKAGVRKGDAVVTQAGAVGQVLLTGKRSSEVLLLSDASSAVDVIVQRSRARGIMKGLQVSNFDRLGDVQVGDIIVTSGLGAQFPEGTPVGKVSRVQNHRQGLYIQAEIQPFVELNRLESVIVLPKTVRALSWMRKDLVSHLLEMSVKP